MDTRTMPEIFFQRKLKGSVTKRNTAVLGACAMLQQEQNTKALPDFFL